MAADADVYYQSPAGAFTGITAWFCRMTGRRFIFRVASDSDCEKEHGRIQFGATAGCSTTACEHADLVAVQTEFQAQMLRDNHGLESSRRQHAGRAAAPHRAAVAKDIDVLWLSNLRSLKRPELVLELARQLPQVNFTLAGGPCHTDGGRTFDDVQPRPRSCPM